MTGQLRLRLATFVQRLAAPAALLLLLVAGLAPQRAQATHAMGGELTYECIGNDLYLVTLNFYRDCNGVAAPTNGNNGLDFRIRSQACNANFTQNFAFSGVQIITPICSFETDRCTSTNGQYGVERYTYTSTVNLSAFANCNDWIISWDLCCRNNAITSLNQPGGQELYLEARLDNTVNPCNTSPEFLTMPTPFYCVNQPLSYNPGAVDADGDSLAFQLVNARGVNGVNLAYNPGYTLAQPIRNGGGAGAVVLDPQTGTLTCIPNQLQVSVVTYRVNEYRNGVLIGSITRDIQFVIRSCTGQPPTASGVNGGGNYSVEVCAGTPVSFTVTSSDPNGDNTFLTWNSGIPGATFTAAGAPFQTGTFNWTPTNANIGQNFFTVTVQDNGCPLVGTNDYGFTVIVTPPNTPVDAGPNQNVCATSATLAATLPFSQAPHNWSVISGTGTFANAGDPNTTVSGLSIGANVFQWNVNYQTCGTATDQVTITRYDNAQPAANAGPDQELCLPTNSATLAANNAIAPAVGTWTVIQGTGTFANANSPTSGVSNLGVGINRFRWTINNGPCGNTQDDVVITVFDNTQPVANAGPDIQLCTPTNTATMQGSAVTFPATGLWTLTGGAGGTITTPTSPTTTITGLPVGVHTYTWTVSNGPCGAPTSDQVTITVFDQNSPNANAGADQQICATTTSLTGSVPTAPATGAWSVVQGGGAITNPTSPITGVTGLTVGTNIFQWTVNNGPCTNGVTSDQVTVVVFDPNSPAANAGPNQEICNQITTATMAANVPTAPATGTWSVQNGGGTIADPTSPTTTISNLPVGENIFVWTVTNGPCPGSTTTDQVTVWVYDQNAPIANAGPDQEICTPTSSVGVTGNAPIFPQTGQWTLVSGSGTITNANSPSTTITGLPVGVHVFAWTLDNGVCSNPVTVDEVTITVYDASTPIANAGPDQELCTPASTTTLQGSALIFPATGQWTLISGSAVIDDPTDPNTQISGLSVGTVVMEWTVDNGPCTANPTSDQVTIEIFDAANPAADAGPDQDICTPTNSVTMAASTVTAPAVGTWVLISGAGGTVADVNDPNTDITNLPIGVHVYEWQVDNGSCFGANTNDQVTISVFAGHQAVAGAGPDQEICIPTFPNTVTLAGTPVIFPGTGTWTLVSGSGTITDPNDPNTTVTGLTVGTSVFQWTVTNGPTCANPLTTDQMTVFVFDQGNPVANAGPDFQLCTPLTSAQLSGSALNGPATGQWTVQSGTGVFADPTDPNTTVSGISLGPNEYVWTVSNGPCVNPITSDQVTVTLFNGNSQQAAAGADQSFCTPTSSTTMNATPVFAPATASWSLISGGGQITNNNPNTSITNLPVGINVFQWTVDNGACGSTTDQVSILIFDANNPVANAGADQELCTPTTQTTLTGSSLIVPATGLWTLVSGSGNIVSPTTSSTLVNSLGIGDNVFVWTVTNGPCANSITTDTVVVSVFDSSADVADAGPDRTLCSPLPFIVMQGNAATAPGVGTWTTVVGTGIANDPNSPTTVISGISVGDNIYVWTIDNGACGTSSDSTLLVLHNGNLPVADAGPDQELCLPTTNTTLAGSPAPYPATGLWSLISGTGAISDNTISNPTVSGLSLGINQFEWVVFNAPCANAITRDTVTIVVFDPNEPAADAGDDQDLCTPLTTTNLAGNTPTFPAVGFWTTSSGATIADPADPNTLVSGLAIGENIFTWTIDNGSCNGGVPTTDQVSIFVYDENNPIAAAGPDQQLCLPTTSAQLSASTYTFPATGQWSVQQGQGIFSDATDPNATVTGLAVGENIFVWTVNNGPCANPITTDAVSIFLFDDQQADASAGPDQNLCTPNINATMAGNATTFPAIGTWTLVSGSGTITDANDPTTVISNLGIGENVFAWTIDNGPCANGITSDTVRIFLFDETNANADAGPDQEICTPQSSVTLAGSAVTFPAVGTWTIVSGTAILSDVNDPLAICTGLGVGEVVLEWTVDNGPCGQPTTDQVSIFIFDEFSASADAGPDQELCTPTSSTTLSGSVPTFPSTGTWTLVSGSGIPVDPSDPNTVVNGLAVGENIFEWTVDNGPCANGTTTDQVSIFIFDENNPVADAGPDQDLCTPNNFTTLAGSSVIFPAAGTWTLIGGTATITDATDPGTTITAIGVGTATLVWSVDNGPCANGITTDTVNITLYDGSMQDADAGPDQNVCDDAPQATMAGSAVIAPGTGVWTLASGGGTIVDPNDPNTLITGLPVGENIFVWSVTNGPCAPPTSDAVSIFVFDDGNAISNAGPDQQVCTPLTSATLSGSPVTFPATGSWILIGGSGTITDPSDPNTTVTNLGIGNNEFVWVVNNGPCLPGVSLDNVIIQLFDLNQPPAAAGPDQELCTPNTTAAMAGNTPAGVAVGTWSAVGAGTFADVNDPTTDVSGLIVGENVLVWTIDNGICGISSDSISVFVFDEFNPAANAGPDVEQCTPNDSIVMAGNTPTFPAIGTWSLIQGAGLFADVNDPNTLVVGMAEGYNTFVWTVDNGPCPNGITTDTMTVILFPDSTPAPVAGPDVEICLPQNTANITATVPPLPFTGFWSIVNGSGTIADSLAANTTVTGLTLGVTTLLWTIDNGPCPDNIFNSDTLLISVFDPTAPPADAGPDQEICTPTDSTVMQGNSAVFPGYGTWSLVSGTGQIADVSDPNSSVTGLTVGQNIFVWEIYNGNCGLGPNITRDTVSVFVFDDTAQDATAGPDQEFCTPTSTSNLSANSAVFPGFGSWTTTSGTAQIGAVADPNSPVSNLTVGTHTFIWTIDNGPCPNGLTSDTLVIEIYDGNAPAADAGPDQEICIPTFPNQVTMAANLPVAPATGFWTLISGTGVFTNPSSPNTEVTGMSIGTNVFEWSIANGPCGTTTSQVTVTVFNAAQPDAAAGPDQEICTPTSSVTMAGNTATLPATGAWTIISGAGNITDATSPTTTVTGLQPGVTTLVWTIDNGPCANGITTDTMTVTVFDNTLTQADAGIDQDFCSPVTSVTLDANQPPLPATGQWTVVSGGGAFTDASSASTEVTGLDLGANVFEWTVSNGPCGTTTDQVTITIYDSAIDTANAGESLSQCQHLNTSINLNAVPATSTGTGVWTLVSGSGTLVDPSDPTTLVTDLQEGINVFAWTINNGPCPASADTMIVEQEDCLTLIIPDAFSPNGDGVNDTYVIDGLQFYPQNSIKVFNRWGNIVLERSPYNNDWDGRSENSMNWGEELPESTYYMILDLGNGDEPYTGYIYLKR